MSANPTQRQAMDETGRTDGVGAGGAGAAPAALEQLSPERLLLLRRRLLERASQRIPRREGGGPAPLSFAQQRLWFIHQLDPASPAYNMPARLRLRGPLDVAALRRAVGEVARRHEAVRTTLAEVDGEAVQLVHPPAPFPLPVADVGGLPAEARVAEARRLVELEAARPFDLRRGPLLRGLLVRMDAEDWAVCFTMHHAVSDGWSVDVLTREVSALYRAYSRGEPSPLPELEIQYADFAAWQRRWLSGAALERQLGYWRERLAGAPPLLELPTDHPRRGPVGVSEHKVTFVLPPGVAQALRELSRAEGATTFMTMLAAWQTLLGRYAGQDDVVVGTPIANRTRRELEPLIGFFVNTLVLRADLSGDPGFRVLLERVRESTLGAYGHQDLPFERLVEELAPERSLTHNPLFQVMFALQNNQEAPLALGGVAVEAFRASASGTKFDLELTLWERGERLSGDLTYREDLFEPATIRRMAEHFRLLLEGITADPDRPLSTLRLVGPAEERQLLSSWNPPRAYSADLPVPALFAEQARRTPDAPAVEGPDGALTYAELDARSSRLAHALRALGTGPETPVGVCLERGPELLVAVLGAWKAGAAYLPLDPSYPAERLGWMLADAAVPVLLSRRSLAASLPPHGAVTLLFDGAAERIAAESTEAPAVDVVPESLAYVIYTSGSTGRPKGVRVSHRSLVHTLAAAQHAFGFGEGDLVPSLASFSFDIWLFEAVLPLLAGGRVRIVPREQVLEVDRLPERLEDATALHAVPALMRQLAQVLRAGGRTLPGLRQAFVGGDAVAPDLLEEMREVFPAAAIHVLYGPTEGAIICAAHAVREGEPRRQWVGRPLGNATLYVLDRALQPVPVGVPGELCIGGESAARDYLGRPDTTAEKWSPDPFALTAGARLYRTGDRVRWTAAGELEFLGRVDAQVKIRGFRIEPGEVESVIAAHPGVQDAVVLVREDVPGEKRLVGYVVPADAGGDDADGDLQHEHVGEWESLFEDAYASAASDADPAFNVAGWNSSYTGEPIPAQEMREWVEAAAGSIRALRPRRVLEIGCGTGLLLFRVAPQCEEYWGTDFSAPAIDFLRREVARPGRELPQVTLLERGGGDFTGIPAGHFDLVVINSVVQYFPGVDYLLRVLEGAVGALAPGGRVWVGDVRSLPLLDAFQASVELAQAGDATPGSVLRDRARRPTAREKELLVDPELFRALPHLLPRVSGVEVRLKPGAHPNEMTRFRYDVLLHVEGDAASPSVDWQRWDDGLTLDAVARRLDDGAADTLAIAQVPNARVDGALAAVEALASDEARTAEQVRALATEREAAAVDPEALRRLAEARGYRAHLRWSRGASPGRFDVLLVRDGSTVELVEDVPATPLPWSAYANDPLARRRADHLLPELRAALKERLPEYMVPGALVLLDTLPLTPNGKVDRRALPAPEAAGLDGSYRAPRNPTEVTLAGIWASVLQVERVGVEDDFFALGGHSLLATRVVSRVREALDVEVPLRSLFEAPTVAALAARVDDLLQAGTGVQLPPLRPTPRTGPLPLSFAQQRLWFIHQLEPASPAYNMPFPLRLRGGLEPAVLEQALTELARRHESLRTVFHAVEGEPVQVILPAAPVAVPVVELRTLADADRERTLLRLAREEAARPFDLARGPLLRSTLVRAGDEEWAVLFTLHHVVSDGWSMGVLVREVSALYGAFLNSRPSPLREPALQYADYAVWQRGWLAGDTLDAQLAYWRATLSGASPLLELPTDRPRPLVASDRAGQRTFTLSEEASRELRALSQREGATLFMTLLAAYAALLARWSGQDDVSVGTPLAGRNHLGLEGLIGFFVNTLVLRSRLDGRPTFRQLVGRVRETVLGAQAHQDLPFERLVDELGAERSLDHAPLFQAMFALQAASPSDERLSLGGARIYPLHAGETTAKWDLSLTLEDGGERLVGSVIYRADLFDAATVERMLGHFRNLAERAASDPDRPIAEVDVLTPGERAELLDAEQTRRDYPAGTVHGLFDAQVRRTPEAVAIRFAGEELTYAELDARANRLANLLRTRGVGPEVAVGICLPRTPEMVVALLAVLKSGGAYVPLDPAYPAERLGYMLEDAGARLVVTTTALAGRLPARAEPIALDALGDELARGSDDAPESGATPENLSHVIFTSGSTGRPKGVMIRHSSTVVLLHWLRESVSDEERSAVLASTSINFDVSVAEIFGTLCWGGTLHLVENALSLAEMGGAGIVLASMVPTAAAELVRMGGIPASVRTLNLAGEALPESLARSLHALGTLDRVANLYGPTEDTTYSTFAPVPRGAERVTIGRPLANTQALVLDAELGPVPVGVAGELYLAGDGLARGYAGRPDLTAERFLPHPSGAPGSRMYRGMDRARRLPDGELEYLGRADQQVKVRGFRIEPGEIESVLLAHPGVRAAVVVVREDAPGDRRLVAYLAADGAPPPADELRARLRRSLPEHMVPGAFVPLDALPLTPGGKLDRRALPAPAVEAGAAEHVPPRTPTEATLAEIFAAVLRREGVGVHDGFFGLGGHSLLATRVVSRVEESFGVEVPLRAVFEAPTVALLAERVEEALRAAETVHAIMVEEADEAEAAPGETHRAAAPAAPATPMEPSGPTALDGLSAERRLLLRKRLRERAASQRIPRREGGGPAPLSFAQQRLWFIHQLDPASPAYNMPARMRLRGPLDVSALRRALGELARRHEAVRTTLAEVDGEAVQVIHPPAPFPLPVVDVGGLPAEARLARARRLVAKEAARPFDLLRGPLLRGLLVRMDADDWAVCFTMHHVVSDGWSVGVLTREVSALYRAYSRGEPSPLPELEIQYADFAAWQRRWLSGEALERQLGFWRERLAGAPPLLELPTDHPRRSPVGVSEKVVSFAFTPGETRALRELSRVEGATTFMTMLAAWQALLARYAGQDDVVVGTPIANRTRAELEPLIGFFVNTLVLRTDVSGDPGFRALLERVREGTLGAFSHQDLPFERLVEELAPERSLTHNPLFQVMFALQNNEGGALALGDVDVEGFGGGESGAKFDLGLTLWERGEVITGDLTYREDLFEPDTVRRMAEHFRLLLEGVAADPGRPVSTLRLVGPAEERQLLSSWNPPRGYSADRLVPALFAEQARRTPDAPAVEGPDGALTYAELDARSSRLAHALRALGAGPETPVGVCLERGPELLVAVLGAWKAGAAYLPLDPSYPAERLGWMLADAAVPVLLSRRSLAAALPPHAAAVLLVDGDAERIAAESAEAPAVDVAPESLAYVIYTSGSTGRPKGVRVSHRNLLHTLAAAQHAFGFGEGDLVPSLASFSFDIWIFEAVLPLLAGGRVRIVPREQVLEVDRLPERLEDATALHAVPALMRQLAQVLRAGGRTLPGLRQAFVGGDAVSPDLLEEMREVFPAAAIHVLYGPTEGTIICAAHAVREGEPRRQWVGRPLGNATLYVLDRALQPVPVGVPGELCIGGESAARDYLGRPDTTAEKWSPDPFALTAGARLYRTGDRVRWTAAGELEFLGRVDSQVKIRGFRIEPGEVESVIAAHPGVQDAVVLVREDVPGEKRLVGYVVPADAGGDDDGDLHSEHVGEWESLFGDTYSDAAEGDEDPAFNVAGWNSSYTGEPIPAQEMREWVEAAAGSIRALNPRRVLEIGCGTGLLLFRVAPQCEEYWGTDFSAPAIDFLRREVARPGRELPNVTLLERGGGDFTGIPAGHFDLVVINSVVQYFPGVDYLLRVLEGAVGALAPGGRVWVGDVRSLPLLDAFHASVELAQAGDATPGSVLRDRARRRTAREKELLVDPELFRALPHLLPRVSGVEVRLKPGAHPNEMTRFRYDVLLHVERDAASPSVDWQRWDDGLTLDAVARRLDDGAPDTLAIAQVPNARVEGALATVEALASDEARTTDEVRALATEREAAAVDPEAVRRLAGARGYRAHLRWSRGGAPGRFDVLLVRNGSTAELIDEIPATPLPWSAYANDPLARRRADHLLPELRAVLKERLPEYMVPGALVLLDALPLTPNGKVDRRALPAPESAGLDGSYRAPRNATEETLAGIWASVLQVERVGVEDDFFALGGHSLLATRVVSRVREALEVEVPLRALFEAPTVAALAARIDALLQAGTGVQLPPLRSAPRSGPLPLSFAQQRLWFIHQLEPQSPAYNMPFPLRLRGGLEPAVLERALTELVRRHESLRTVFHAVEGEPVQVILPAAPVAVPVVELRTLADADRERTLLRLAREEAARPFDLARGPLLRSTLVRAGDEEWAVLFTMHHVVSDGWSMGVLVREVSALYGAFLEGRPSPLPEPALQYADYAVWQRDWLAGETLEAQLAYWRETLSAAPPLLELPTDRPRPLVASDRAGQRTFTLSEQASRELRALSQREGATLFMTMLAAYAALLSRWSGQDDVSVGTPLAGRNHLGLEGLIGFFVNTLVLRSRLDGRPTFRQLVGRVRETVLGAQAHQDLPFERLVDELGVERSLDHAPLFQAMFALQAASPSDERLSLGGARVYPLHAGETTAKWDLSLTLEDGGERLVGSVIYRADLFDAETVERMLGHFRNLAERAAADPDRPIAEVDVLTSAERAELLDAEQSRRDYPAGTVHALFDAQVRRTPDAVAIRFAGEELTYAELDARANRLANLLRARGVGPEVAVGICLPRTPEMVVALLAVLKAGGAYVPLDPAYPAERLGYMLEDADAGPVITTTALAGRLPARAEPIALDELRVELAQAADDAPESGATPENLSHVIFTSGSTGRPKGVMIRHSSTVVLLHWLRESVSDEERSAVLASTSINFDVSVAEIFGTLCWGGTLHLVENALSLAAAPDRERIRYASMVPTAAAELLRMGAIPRGVRTLNLGGEALPSALARELYALGTVERVGNLYGPTEDTTYSTFAVVPRGAERVTVGRPVANTQALVLDAELGPAPAGVVGELYLAGDGLARGYAGRPDLTAERFLPHPFGAPGARMYRVMDRVRRLLDGELDYLGRTDTQVKVRGFRIELGEIESVLLAHPGVRAAAAAVREDVPGDRRLVAYLAVDRAAPPADELRERLRRSLPEHMVPSAFVVLDALPLTPNGKTDRGALPAPERAGTPGAERVPPRDALELALAGIWEEVLGASDVGVRDNFFEAGGHSLLAVRLMARIESVLGARLPLPALFAAPTVEALAAMLRDGPGGIDASPLVPVRASGDRPPLFLVHPVGGDVLCYAPLVRHLAAEQPVYALRSRGLAGVEPAATVDAMAADYLDALRAQQPAGPYRLGGWSMGGVVAFEMARRLEAAGETVEALVLIDSLAPALAGLAAPEDDATLVNTFAADLGVPLDGLPASAEGAPGTDAREHLGRVLEAARGAGLVPPDIGFEQVWRMYRTFRANLRAMYAYRPGAYGGRVVLLRAADHGAAETDTSGWEAAAAGGVEVRTVPGSHFTLVREPHAAELARAVSEALDGSGAG